MNCDRIYPFDDCGCDCCDGAIARKFVLVDSAITSLDKRLIQEQTERHDADIHLSDRIDKLEEDSSSKCDEIEEKLNAEIERATTIESQLNASINYEIERAKTAETNLDNSIKAETAERLQADEAINETISNMQKQVAANTEELARTKWTQTVIDLQ